ncbi:hypothetical protein [Alkalimarinus coralli]|uniref:hypothetical protein n=1 Tax=Alkalimarinus coralli TaxID=2935863 RepID=UPI00202AFD8F|nr:hypothetical protein [Alkalimarinus coralli]
MTTATATQFTELELTLDTLSEKSVEELSKLYQNASLPKSMKALDGSPKGRMLAIRGIDKTPLFGATQALSKVSVFPWNGKSFQAKNNKQGTGINRINLTLAQKQWFPFNTVIVPSVIDGKECIYLDYDLPGNPWFIRKIRDELREVSPGLFLGPAMWKDGKESATLLLWFAIDTNQ